jgi:hypothetical protein
VQGKIQLLISCITAALNCPLDAGIAGLVAMILHLCLPQEASVEEMKKYKVRQ